ncbi:unnamed protein product [Triticum turgidum subsp. durum]|uniref:FAS1 domain-containing protein n=1 Tax=Triticum turgidum subsp. durum TaxID=4567 RepID=A0A9R1QKD2_TRITD|nr:unnamed protein product [Triticum turgidum subsp. durum]
MAARSGIVVVAAALLALVAVSQAQAPGPSATPAGPPNVTAILVKGGQYTTFNGNGYTVFAPTDNAFNNLKPGTLNSLTQQQQVSLVQAHILPQYYTMESFQTASNPVRTQASGEKEPITVNIVATNNQVNVTTGLVEVAVNNALSAVKPLAVYSVDKVLLPQALFGAKAPAPAPAAPKGAKTKKGEAASGPAASDDDAAPTGAAGARAVGWGMAGMAALLGYLL